MLLLNMSWLVLIMVATFRVSFEFLRVKPLTSIELERKCGGSLVESFDFWLEFDVKKEFLIQ